MNGKLKTWKRLSKQPPNYLQTPPNDQVTETVENGCQLNVGLYGYGMTYCIDIDIDYMPIKAFKKE